MRTFLFVSKYLDGFRMGTNYEGVVEISANSPGVVALSLIQEVATGDVATVSVLTQDHIITDTDNTALGVGALSANTEGVSNTAVGVGALQNNSQGKRNTAVGLNALSANIDGILNTAIGFRTLENNTSGGTTLHFSFRSPKGGKDQRPTDSSENRLKDLAVNVGQAVVTTIEAVGQALVINTH